MKKQIKNINYFKGKTQPHKKKELGQHFLRDQSVVDHMIEAVKIDKNTSILEIGCGDGFLTRSILAQTICRQLWSIEIDSEWAMLVQNSNKDSRLTMHHANILEFDWTILQSDKPWILLANLPYNITFPILFLLIQNRALFAEGVVMVQEEVAQKIVATRGKKYGVISLKLQHVFDFELLDKITPSAFNPPPKVYSRLISFKRKKQPITIDNEKEFYKFAKLCFRFARQTLKNNLKSTHYDVTGVAQEIMQMRAQQLSFEQLLVLWNHVKNF